jgi:DNA-binding MarR family transcriptional regulator
MSQPLLAVLSPLAVFLGFAMETHPTAQASYTKLRHRKPFPLAKTDDFQPNPSIKPHSAYQTLCSFWNKLYNIFRGCKGIAQLIKADLKLSAWRILEYLCTLSEEALKHLKTCDIARATALSRMTVATQLKWLIFFQLIEREQFDSWYQCIRITEQGRQALKEHRDFGYIPSV